MSIVLTKSQNQELGIALQRAGYEPQAFVRTESSGDADNSESVTLTSRDTADTFTITRSGIALNRYVVSRSVPGTSRTSQHGSLSWHNVADSLEAWAKEVKQESEAIDPWEEEAEEMAN